MTVRQIVSDHLKKNGRDCLFCKQDGCSCKIEKLFLYTSEEGCGDCEMGYIIDISALCQKCKAYGAAEDYCPYLYDNNDDDSGRWIISKSKRHPCRGFKES